jgi:endoglucanase
MRQTITLLAMVVMMNNLLTATEINPIKVDLLGYQQYEEKYAIVSEPSKNFAVKKEGSSRVIYANTLQGPVRDILSGEECYIADFSALTEAGEYYIEVNDKIKSLKFKIASNPFKAPFVTVMRGFYLQRCGTHVKDPGGFSHGPCHLEQAILHESTGEKREMDASGGWHDAGDYGRYVVNSGISTATLLYMFERYKAKVENVNLSIPESGSEMPDVLSEAKWNIDWMLKMQAEDGGVYHKVTPRRFPGWIRAEDDSAAEFVFVKTSTAAANLAAVCAVAARVYKYYDAAFSERCLKAAEKSWQYLQKNPEIVPAGGFLNPPDSNTGQYKDSYDKDERFWAATELFITTGNTKYEKYVEENFRLFEPSVDKPAYWWETQVLAMFSYVYNDFSKNPEIVKKIKSDLKNSADIFAYRVKTNGYKMVLEEGDFIWGSNSVALNMAVNLVAASELLRDEADNAKRKEYKQAAREVLHYVFGRNPMGMSYVTGIGERRPMRIHHRPSEADKIEEPYPGLLAGGPNKGKQDPELRKLDADTPPAKSFVDELESYASNEIAINWNAPLAYLMAAFIE